MTLDVEHTIAGLEAEVDALRRKVAFVMKANATYSAGHATLHQEHDETRQQLLLAMHWGRELAAVANRTPEQVSRGTSGGGISTSARIAFEVLARELARETDPTQVSALQTAMLVQHWPRMDVGDRGDGLALCHSLGLDGLVTLLVVDVLGGAR